MPITTPFDVEKNSLTRRPEGMQHTVIGYTNVEIASKLMPMGLRVGSKIIVVRHAPFEGGYYCKIESSCGGFCTGLALRYSEANCILVD